MIETQIIHGMPAPDYHKLPGLSSTGIKHLIRSPAHFMANARDPFKPTPAMEFGTAIHAATLEPQRFNEIVFVIPADAPDKRTKDGRAFWEEAERVAAGRVMLRAEDVERVKQIAANVRNSAAASLFLNGDGYVESSVLWQHDTGSGKLPARARPDYMTRDCSIIVDLKSADDASPQGFQRALWNYRYDIQAAWYIEGITVATERIPHSYLFCVVETKPPFAVAWYRIAPSALAIAWGDIQRAALSYQHCTASGEWPAYPDEIMQIELPRYARGATEPITED